jgi:sec-independent protein translocase protein TatA
MFTNLGSTEILIVVLVLVFLFGGKKLPDIAKELGSSGKELKKAKKEIEKAMSETLNDNETDNKTSTEESRKGGDQS